jgi:omega-hydroxy-beta-dihydromenaquinone-9 sulfotransferase
MNKINNRSMIFVVGNSRSGTTMMGWILGKNKHVFTFHEIHFFEQLWSPKELGQDISYGEAISLMAQLISIEREGYLNNNRNIDIYEEEAKVTIDALSEKNYTKTEIFEAFLEHETQKYGKTIPCDQTPRNLFYVKEIMEIYPEAKIIYMVRDPRDVLLSQKNKWRRRFLDSKNTPINESLRAMFNYHPYTISKLWNSAINSMKEFYGHPRVMTVRFEQLLENPEKIIQEVCTFLGIEFDIEMLNIPQIGSSIIMDQVDKIGINKDRLHAFSKGGLNNTELFICEKITKDNMLHFHYRPIGYKANLLLLVYYCISFPFRASISLLLNLRRMENIVETIKRRI